MIFNNSILVYSSMAHKDSGNCGVGISYRTVGLISIFHEKCLLFVPDEHDIFLKWSVFACCEMEVHVVDAV